MAENIFDWVRDTFTAPKMQTAPHVVDQGSYVYDPETAAAEAALGVPPVEPLPQHAQPVPAGTEDDTVYIHGQPVSYSKLLEAQGQNTGEPTYDPVPGMPADEFGMTPMDQDMVDAMGEAALDDPNSLLPPPMDDPNAVPNGADYRGIIPAEDGMGADGLIPMEGYNPVDAEGKPQDQEKPTPNPHPEALPGLTDPVKDEDPDLTKEDAEEIVKGVEATGPVNGVDPEQVKKVAAEDPKGFKKAMNWFADTMGLQSKDLYRMAFLYAGSRIAGYDHSGSMSWAFETGMKMVDGRESMVQRLQETGKYTPKSIEEFKKTGDRSKLKLTTSSNPVKTDFTKPMVGKDGKRYYKRTDKTGNVWYETVGGGRSDGTGLRDPSDDQSRVEMMNEAAPKVTELVNDMLELNGVTQVKGEPTVPGWKVPPTAAGTDGMAVILDNYPNFNHSDEISSSMFNDVMRNATEMAIADAKRGKTVTDIKPYVLAQIQYYTDDGNDGGWKQSLMNTNGEKLKMAEWTMLRGDVVRGFEKAPEYQKLVEKVGQKEAVNRIFQKFHKEWQTAVPEEKRNKGTSTFYGWLNNQMTTKKDK